MSSFFAANAIDAATLADQLARFRVIPPDRLAERLAELAGDGPEALVNLLISRGDLTPFQGERALAGESRSILLGPYRLTGFASLGTFGPAYAAQHLEKSETFRVHLFPLRSLWRARKAKQLARSLAKVEHPAVVPLVDADSANGLHYLVWPLIEGTTLSTRLAAGPLSPSEVTRMLATLAEALHACHSCKIVHGAITPGAVLFDTMGTPRLLDLGAGAILTSNLEDEESLLDTLSRSFAAVEIVRFAAPELVAGESPAPAADQYALGAIGYYALTGEAPFAASSLAEVLASKAGGKLMPLAPDISAELIDIIERMLLPAAEERFPSLDEVHARLSELRRNAEAAAAEPTAESSPAKPLAPNDNKPAEVWGPLRPLPEGLPVRDDSDASIDFEMPPSPPEPVMAEPPIPAVETPSQRFRETEAVRRQDAVRTEPEPKVEATASAPVEVKAGQVPLERAEPGAHNKPTVVSQVSVPKALPAAHPSGGERPSPSRLTASVSRSADAPKTGSIKSPVEYHTEPPTSAPRGSPGQSPEEQAGADTILWRKVKKSLLFWQSSMDVLQVSIYAPARLSPGQPAKLSVYLHTEETTENVRTLSRAFHHDAELIGSGLVAREVARNSELAVHLSVANAGITKSLQAITWLGQPHRLVFDLHVPWESPAGPAPGLVSIGRENVRIGKVEFRLTLLPRKG